MARLYANENFPHPAVEHLRASGHDVLTSHEAGNANQGIPDDQVLAFATSQGRAVITLNRRDFVRLHVFGGMAHEGIITCVADANYAVMAERADRRIQACGSLTGQLLHV